MIDNLGRSIVWKGKNVLLEQVPSCLWFEVLLFARKHLSCTHQMIQGWQALSKVSWRGGIIGWTLETLSEAQLQPVLSAVRMHSSSSFQFKFSSKNLIACSYLLQRPTFMPVIKRSTLFLGYYLPNFFCFFLARILASQDMVDCKLSTTASYPSAGPDLLDLQGSFNAWSI